MVQTNLLKLDRVQNEATRVIVGTVKDTPTETMMFNARPPTKANQTESGAGQSVLRCCRKSPQPTPRRDADWEGASLGWVQQRTQYCKYASRQSSSKPRSEKGTQTDSIVSMKHSCQKTWESTVENSQQAKQSQRSSFSFKKTANCKTS